MPQPHVITTLAEAQLLDKTALPVRREPSRILMCPPDYFEIKDVKNAFMQGNIGTLDKALAVAQWDVLKTTFEQLGKPVVTIEPAPDLEDMVFSANQVLPGLDEDGTPYVVISRMRYPSRQREIPFYREWFADHGYRILELEQPGVCFEGQGDAIWHPGRKLLWGGHGQRTDFAVYPELSERLGIPILALELSTPEFYHLDTCFCALDEQSVLIYPQAFTSEGLALIHRFFPLVIEAPSAEAHKTFACNAFAFDGRNVVIQWGATETVAELRRVGFHVTEVDTSEFIKSGGSVFCMKMEVY
ncbi:MAG TPA: arginine deiminase-related protein [Acidobacteriota bacterium]|nr:arginine deiminase-related protein [Acidobacteriota bacterium]HND20937.1 arginine deiminase-related protein [Acidobacteriota bacterium]HNG95100.1 arginine deiminase-related protein [Acidobacteriota bacterium]HNH81048.1 arginine deiminase-related protein [Acidobacteriota bacterium]HNJ39426.1 arginine deiminase-related protein [Acidobacteriota bacterium]